MTPPDFNALSDEEFRAKVREFFAAHYPPHLRFVLRRARLADMMDWYLTLSRHGWIAPNWPREYGGMGLDTGKMLILLEESERYGVSRVPDHGIVQVGPIIMKYGQRRTKKILPAENTVGRAHLGPGLFGTQCRLGPGEPHDFGGARRHRLHRQRPENLDHARARLDAPLHAGAHEQGRQETGRHQLPADRREIAGHHHPADPEHRRSRRVLRSVFRERAGAAGNLVGGLNKGWTVAKALLSFERINIGSPRRPQYALKRLEQLARAKGLFDDPGFVDKFTALELDLADLGSLYARYVEVVKRGEELGQEVSMLKIWAMESWQRLTDLLIETAQEYGGMPGEHSMDGAEVDVLSPFYYARPGTIYGGSSEIQRNILAKYVLKLPA